MLIIVKRLIKIWNSRKFSISLHRKTESEAKMKVRCLEQIQKSGVIFRTGETYTASEVNEHWYVVDAIGFETNDFNLHFEELGELTEEDASEKTEQESYQVITTKTPILDEPIVPGLSDKEDKKEEKEVFFDRLMNYVFLIR